MRQRLDYVQNFHLKVEMRWWSKEEGESGSEGRDRERESGWEWVENRWGCIISYIFRTIFVIIQLYLLSILYLLN